MGVRVRRRHYQPLHDALLSHSGLDRPVLPMFNPALESYPAETLLMGKQVIGYGEIEFSFATCAGLALDKRDLVLRAVHTIQSESGRLELANSLSVCSKKK